METNNRSLMFSIKEFYLLSFYCSILFNFQTTTPRPLPFPLPNPTPFRWGSIFPLAPFHPSPYCYTFPFLRRKTML